MADISLSNADQMVASSPRRVLGIMNCMKRKRTTKKTEKKRGRNLRKVKTVGRGIDNVSMAVSAGLLLDVQDFEDLQGNLGRARLW